MTLLKNVFFVLNLISISIDCINLNFFDVCDDRNVKITNDVESLMLFVDLKISNEFVFVRKINDDVFHMRNNYWFVDAFAWIFNVIFMILFLFHLLIMIRKTFFVFIIIILSFRIYVENSYDCFLICCVFNFAIKALKFKCSNLIIFFVIFFTNRVVTIFATNMNVVMFESFLRFTTIFVTSKKYFWFETTIDFTTLLLNTFCEKNRKMLFCLKLDSNLNLKIVNVAFLIVLFDLFAVRFVALMTINTIWYIVFCWFMIFFELNLKKNWLYTIITTFRTLIC